jgi:hypothetical protein
MRSARVCGYPHTRCAGARTTATAGAAPQDRAGDEVGAVVGPEIAGRTWITDEAGENVDDPAGSDAAGDVDSQRLARPPKPCGQRLPPRQALSPVEGDAMVATLHEATSTSCSTSSAATSWPGSSLRAAGSSCLLPDGQPVH